MVAAAAVAGALTAAYFIHFRRPPYHPVSPGLWPTALAAAQFLTMAFGLEGKALWHPAGYMVFLLFGLSGLVLVFSWISRPEERRRTQALLFFAAGLGCLALGVGWGRSGFGEEAALEPRYVTIAAPFLCGVYLIWSVQPGRAAQVACGLLSLSLCAALPFNMNHGFNAGKVSCYRADMFLRDLRDEMGIMGLAKKYSEKGFLQIHRPALDFAIHLSMLWRAGIKPFPDLNGPFWLGTVSEAEAIPHGPYEKAFSVPHDARYIRGWVGDLTRPDIPVRVSFYEGSELLATTLADEYGKEDFFRLSLDAGNHAFSFAIPERLCDGRKHFVTVRITGTSTELLNSSYTVCCGSAR
jgi:hypothetical protein